MYWFVPCILPFFFVFLVMLGQVCLPFRTIMAGGGCKTSSVHVVLKTLPNEWRCARSLNSSIICRVCVVRLFQAENEVLASQLSTVKAQYEEYERMDIKFKENMKFYKEQVYIHTLTFRLLQKSCPVAPHSTVHHSTMYTG